MRRDGSSGEEGSSLFGSVFTTAGGGDVENIFNNLRLFDRRKSGDGGVGDEESLFTVDLRFFNGRLPLSAWGGLHAE